MRSTSARKRGTAGAQPGEMNEYGYEHINNIADDVGSERNGHGIGKAKTPPADKGLSGDYGNIALLLLLYTLQGVPLGLAHTLDLILQEKSISFEEQGIFSFTSLPYSVKLLWAPIVDSMYIAKVGRRKSWLLPVQILLGLLMIVSSEFIPHLLGEDDGSSPRIYPLTGIFFTFYFLAATQDIAVDGWAVTMLQRHNVGYASTCNVVGQTFGYFIAFTGFIGMKMYGLMNLPQFMQAWGIVFVLTTVAIGILKNENKSSEESKADIDTYDNGEEEEEEELSVKETYVQMMSIVLLNSVKMLILILFTKNVAFAAADNLAQRKLMQRGMKKEHVASLMVFVTPLGIILPGFISKYVSDKPMALFKRAYLPRIVLSFCASFLLFLAPDFHDEQHADGLPFLFFIFLVCYVIVHSVLSNAMFVAQMGFFAKVADPRIGGTYMTLLNTIANFGSNLPNQAVLFLVSKADLFDIDGFYILNGCCVVFGLLWYSYFGSVLDNLESLDTKAWHVASDRKKQKD